MFPIQPWRTLVFCQQSWREAAGEGMERRGGTKRNFSNINRMKPPKDYCLAADKMLLLD